MAKQNLLKPADLNKKSSTYNLVLCLGLKSLLHEHPKVSKIKREKTSKNSPNLSV